MTWETVIGLETHVELATKTKIFCSCTTAFGGAPNTHCCPVCTGMPGALPVLNGKVVEYAVRAAMAGGRTLTPAFLKELCVTLGGGDRGEVEEDFANWHVTALTVGEGRVPADIPALNRAVERLKPAHLSVTVLPTADLTARRWAAVTGGVMMEVWG